MKNFVLLLFVMFLQIWSWAQSSGKINGKIIDDKNQPMPGASVTIRETNATTVSDNAGMFSFTNVTPGNLTLIVSFVGYSDAVQTVRVKDGETTDVSLNLSTSSRAGQEIVVTASKRPEKITRAPATISVISSRDLDQSA